MQLLYCEQCGDHFPRSEFDDDINPDEVWHFPYNTGQVGHIAEID